MPKLFLYKARDAPVAVILRRGEKRRIWEMIRWDLETDTFTRGQWLTRADQMNGRYGAISPDGRHFAYHYSEHKSPFTSHAIISEVPYFTALLYTSDHAGFWDSIGFSASGQPMHTRNTPLKKRNPTSLKQTLWQHNVPSGYMEHGTFTDPRGRTITTEKGQLFADGELLYDCTEHTFCEVRYGDPLLVEEAVAAVPPLRRSARLAGQPAAATKPATKPAAKKRPNVWIQFVQRVRKVLTENDQDIGSTANYMQFCGALKQLKGVSCTDADILVARSIRR